MSILRKMWRSNAKHKKLIDDWALAGPECGWMSGSGADERRFAVKYAGAAPAERAHSGPATAAAVRAAISTHKASGKKMRRVIMTVSAAGILVTDKTTSETLMDFSIFRISYCSADGGVFAFVACGEEAAEMGSLGGGVGEGPLECHAFVCTRRKYARDVSLFVAHAFNAAYQSWQATQESRRLLRRSTTAPRAPLLHLPVRPAVTSITANKPWVSFDDWDSESEDRTPSPDARARVLPLISLEVF